MNVTDLAVDIMVCVTTWLTVPERCQLVRLCWSTYLEHSSTTCEYRHLAWPSFFAERGGEVPVESLLRHLFSLEGRHLQSDLIDWCNFYRRQLVTQLSSILFDSLPGNSPSRPTRGDTVTLSRRNHDRSVDWLDNPQLAPLVREAVAAHGSVSDPVARLLLYGYFDLARALAPNARAFGLTLCAVASQHSLEDVLANIRARPRISTFACVLDAWSTALDSLAELTTGVKIGPRLTSWILEASGDELPSWTRFATTLYRSASSPNTAWLDLYSVLPARNRHNMWEWELSCDAVVELVFLRRDCSRQALDHYVRQLEARSNDGNPRRTLSAVQFVHAISEKLSRLVLDDERLTRLRCLCDAGFWNDDVTASTIVSFWPSIIDRRASTALLRLLPREQLLALCEPGSGLPRRAKRVRMTRASAAVLPVAAMSSGLASLASDVMSASWMLQLCSDVLPSEHVLSQHRWSHAPDAVFARQLVVLGEALSRGCAVGDAIAYFQPSEYEADLFVAPLAESFSAEALWLFMQGLLYVEQSAPSSSPLSRRIIEAMDWRQLSTSDYSQYKLIEQFGNLRPEYVSQVAETLYKDFGWRPRAASIASAAYMCDVDPSLARTMLLAALDTEDPPCVTLVPPQYELFEQAVAILFDLPDRWVPGSWAVESALMSRGMAMHYRFRSTTIRAVIRHWAVLRGATFDSPRQQLALLSLFAGSRMVEEVCCWYNYFMFGQYAAVDTDEALCMSSDDNRVRDGALFEMQRLVSGEPEPVRRPFEKLQHALVVYQLTVRFLDMCDWEMVRALLRTEWVRVLNVDRVANLRAKLVDAHAMPDLLQRVL